MRILHVAETIKGGVASVVVPLVTAQVAGKHEIKVLVPDAQRGEVAALGRRVVVFKRGRRGVVGLGFLAVEIYRNLLKFKPEIVHLHSSFAGLVGRLVILGMRPWRPVKVVYCPHGWAFLMRKAWVMRALYTVVERCLACSADAIVCVGTHEWSAAVAAGLPGEKLVVVHNGVARRAYAKKTGRGNVKVLFVGRFDQQKGFDVVLDAMRLLHGKPVELVAVGEALDGTHPPARPNVTYTGWLDAKGVAEQMAKAEVLVMPSRWEGFAMVPLEAMSHGLAVVASDIGPLREVVAHGETGLLVPVDDAAALAEVLADTPRTEWHAMGKAGHARCMKDFSVEQMVAKTIDVYKKVLA